MRIRVGVYSGKFFSTSKKVQLSNEMINTILRVNAVQYILRAQSTSLRSISTSSRSETSSQRVDEKNSRKTKPPGSLAFKPHDLGGGGAESSKRAENISRAMAYYLQMSSERSPNQFTSSHIILVFHFFILYYT